jgi:hypothetical protein
MYKGIIECNPKGLPYEAVNPSLVGIKVALWSLRAVVVVNHWEPLGTLSVTLK